VTVWPTLTKKALGNFNAPKFNAAKDFLCHNRRRRLGGKVTGSGRSNVRPSSSPGAPMPSSASLIRPARSR
jgi:hypothetical protein